MDERTKRKLIQYLTTTMLGLLIAFLYFLAVELFGRDDKVTVMRLLSNGFMVPAVLFLGIGLLSIPNKEGLFDVVVYGTQRLLTIFRLHPKREPGDHSLYAYRKSKEGKRGILWFLIITGAGFALVSAGFVVAFYCVGG